MNSNVVSFKKYKKHKSDHNYKRLFKIYFFWSLIIILCGLSVYHRIFYNKAKPILNAHYPETIQEDDFIKVKIKADPDGHFVFLGKINDVPVKFLYDTGATTVSIPEQYANYIGLNKGKKYYSQTANGRSLSYETELKTVNVGKISINNLSGSVSTGLENDVILLGMSFLKNVSIKYENNELIMIYKKP
jgi:aspartyl protease family protein